MPSRGTFFLLAATVGLGALVVSIVLTYVISIPIGSGGGALLVALSSLILSVFFMHWLGSRIDVIWKNPSANPRAAKLIKEIGQRSATALIGIVAVVVIAYSVAVLLFLPPNQLDIPLQPVLTFIFSGAWFAYILYALSRLVTAEGDKKEDLAAYARNSVIGAIVLSIYFLIPFDWLAQSSYQAFETLAYGAPTGRQFNYSSGNSTINWLQSTAIPSVVSIGFGFLIAYVTSLIWYEYYMAFTGAGLVTVEASRRGRDPSQDNFWFGELGQAKSRAILCGATLGGWFKNWNRLRTSLHELIARESVEQILVILPEPGNPFFWQRREDELFRDKSLWEDPIARLARAIEMLYLVLPDERGQEDSVPRQFLISNTLATDLGHLEQFDSKFRSEFIEKVGTFRENSDNRNVSELVRSPLIEAASRLKQIETLQSIEPHSVVGRIGFLFVRGTMMGVNIFDERIYYTPYLPKIEDKDCPKFTIESHSPLGRSIDRAIEGMGREGIWVFTRSHALAIAFRFWQVCKERDVRLKSLADIPSWLSMELTEGSSKVTPGQPDRNGADPSMGTNKAQ
jgi:hypothetical protein